MKQYDTHIWIEIFGWFLIDILTKFERFIAVRMVTNLP